MSMDLSLMTSDTVATIFSLLIVILTDSDSPPSTTTALEDLGIDPDLVPEDKLALLNFANRQLVPAAIPKVRLIIWGSLLFEVIDSQDKDYTYEVIGTLLASKFNLEEVTQALIWLEMEEMIPADQFNHGQWIYQNPALNNLRVAIKCPDPQLEVLRESLHLLATEYLYDEGKARNVMAQIFLWKEQGTIIWDEGQWCRCMWYIFKYSGNEVAARIAEDYLDEWTDKGALSKVLSKVR